MRLRLANVCAGAAQRLWRRQRRAEGRYRRCGPWLTTWGIYLASTAFLALELFKLLPGAPTHPRQWRGTRPTARDNILQHKKRPDGTFDEMERRRFRRVPGGLSWVIARIPPACATSLRARTCVPVGGLERVKASKGTRSDRTARSTTLSDVHFAGSRA